MKYNSTQEIRGEAYNKCRDHRKKDIMEVKINDWDPGNVIWWAIGKDGGVFFLIIIF